jgi:predicted nuclease of restriction endonuclease-like (RecB) superfamily
VAARCRASTLVDVGNDIDNPPDYLSVLETIKDDVRASRHRAVRVVNSELLALYWRIGRTVLDRQASEGWGAKVIERLSVDLRREFPDMTGLSASNVKYMRRMAAASPKGLLIGQQPVDQLAWGHVTVLLDKLDDAETRDWYAAQAVEHGWSRNVLLNQIKNQTHRRIGAAASNFSTQLPASDSELAQQLTKDPLILSFLDLTGKVAERDLEQAVMDKLTSMLLELGHGFAFVGRQVHFDVGGEYFYVDLLFFHVEQLRYIVVELKVGAFTPEFAGKLGFYVSLVDDTLRKSAHAPTVGLLLCADRNDTVVRYSLGATNAPVAVALYTYDDLPAAEKQALPAADDVAAAMKEILTFDRRTDRAVDHR